MKFNIFTAILNKNEKNLMKDMKSAMENFVIKSKNSTINNNKVNYCSKNGYHDLLTKLWPSGGLISRDINLNELSPLSGVNKNFNDIKRNITKCFYNEIIRVGRHINQIYSVSYKYSFFLSTNNNIHYDKRTNIHFIYREPN